jgi:hypothetical protein
MSHIIHKFRSRRKRAFTLIEALTSTFIALYIFLGAWGIYTMVWRWYHETAPVIEAQRITRAAVSSIVEGYVDSTADTDTIGSATYPRRNGIAWAMFDSDNVPPTTPYISGDKKKIDYMLRADSANARAFYIGADSVTGLNVVYYSYGLTVKKIRPTLGITGLEFDFLRNDDGSVKFYDVIVVTAKVQKNIVGTRDIPLPIDVQYSDYVYLRNIQ